MTVISGPPERSRTSSPLRNAGAAWFCMVAFDGAGAEKAGDKGMPSASVAVIAIKACFVIVNISISILCCAACKRRGDFEMQRVRTRHSSAHGLNMLASGKNKKWLSAICERTRGRILNRNLIAKLSRPCHVMPGLSNQETNRKSALIGAAAVAAAAFRIPALAQAVISDLAQKRKRSPAVGAIVLRLR
jgi:hypothetical protein